jgi:hypothetical protein
MVLKKVIIKDMPLAVLTEAQALGVVQLVIWNPMQLTDAFQLWVARYEYFDNYRMGLEHFAIVNGRRYISELT